MDPMPPEALLESYSPPIRELSVRLRAVVRSVVPDAVERVRPGWRLIGYDLRNGRRSTFFAFVAPEPGHVHLGFENGVLMDDPDHVLLGRGVTKLVRWLTFRPGDPIAVDVLEPLLHEAVRVARMGRGERALRGLELAERERSAAR